MSADYLSAYGAVGAAYLNPYQPNMYPIYQPVADYQYTPLARQVEDVTSTFISPPAFQGSGGLLSGAVDYNQFDPATTGGGGVVMPTGTQRLAKDNPYLRSLYELRAGNLGLSANAVQTISNQQQNLYNSQWQTIEANQAGQTYLNELRNHIADLEWAAVNGDRAAAEELRGAQLELEALLSGQQTARQTEFERMVAAQRDVGAIAEAGQELRQRQAWDTRYQRAGIAPPIEVLKPILTPEDWQYYSAAGVKPEYWDVDEVVDQGNLLRLPLGQRYAIETPEQFLQRQFAANEQDRDLELSDLQGNINEIRNRLDYEAQLRGFDLQQQRIVYGDEQAEQAFQQYLRQSELEQADVSFQALQDQLSLAAYLRNNQETLLEIQADTWAYEWGEPEWGEVDTSWGGQWNNRLQRWVNRYNGDMFDPATGAWEYAGAPAGLETTPQWGETDQSYGGQYNNWEGVWYTADRQSVYNPTPGYEGWRPHWAPRDTSYDSSWGNGAWWQPDWGAWLANDGTTYNPDTGEYGRWY